jgi:transposase
MVKNNDIKLRAQAIILASEGYSHTVIGDKLKRSKSWVTKWVHVVHGRVNDSLIDKKRSGRPKILSSAAKRLVRAAKYKTGQGVRRI